jgi:F-type H+-transporting ATPase subunit gamma
MFRAARFVAPQQQQRPASARGMATLKEITIRLASVKNVQKITSSMKMVSAAKYARAEAALNQARSNGPASLALAEKSDLDMDATPNKQVVIMSTSDRGLCGGIHSQLAKAARKFMEGSEAAETKIVTIGDKQRSLFKNYDDQMLVAVTDVGRKPPQFVEASVACQELLATNYEYDQAHVFYNHYRNAASYEQGRRTVPGISMLKEQEEALSVYDDVDEDVLTNYQEFTLASTLFNSMLEQACSEQSARMTAMENASTNASDMIDKLTILFNRTRQAVVTTELTEIVSGAAALE